MRTPTLALLTLALAAGCGKQVPDSATPPAASAPHAGAHADTPGIAWFDGDVDTAFAAADAQNKPILLYWGAVWCPPCQQLKSTVFSRPDFIEKSKLFIPVYLDGDAPGAQQVGERFRINGYPTMVVLNAQGEEMQRIAGSMDLGQYATLLDTVLGDVQPVNAILDDAAAGRNLTAQQCHRLAYNGWVVDVVDETEYATQASRLGKAAQQCADVGDRIRLELAAANLAADAEADALKAGKAPSAALAASVDRIAAALEDHELTQRIGDALVTLNNNFFLAVKARGGEAARSIAANYAAAMDAVANDPRFAEADQLGALGSKLAAAKALSADGKVPPDLARDARARMDAMLAGDQIPYVRSGIINSAEHILDALDDAESAYRMVLAEMPKSKTAYYYKGDLAIYSEDLGRKDEALDWYKQAYDDSDGLATRFQWGANYLLGLIRIKPEDEARIREVGTQVLAELDGPDRIHLRSRMRLERIERELHKWNASAKGEHSDVIATLRERMQQTCGKIPSADPSRATCESFLAST